MFNCLQITQLVTDYTEGRLSFRQRLRFQLHIGMCRNCRRYLRQMRATANALRSLPLESMPDDVKRELLERFKTWKP